MGQYMHGIQFLQVLLSIDVQDNTSDIGLVLSQPQVHDMMILSFSVKFVPFRPSVPLAIVLHAY